jgi:hypothetical protein
VSHHGLPGGARLCPDAYIVIAPTTQDAIDLLSVILIPGHDGLNLAGGQIGEIFDDALDAAAVPLNVAHDVMDRQPGSGQDGNATPALRIAYNLDR